MIKPDKLLNLNLSVMRVTAEVILLFKEVSVLGYQEVLESLKLKVGDDAKFIYNQSLCFLYILGKIKYDEESDSLIFLNKTT